jgi:hypothetical protein
MPNFPSIYVLRKSLDFLMQLGIGRIDSELKPLVNGRAKALPPSVWSC